MNAELQVEYAPIEDILEFFGNPRAHSKAQVEQIARSIGAFGFLVPVLVDDSNTIIAGHGRILAARHLGLKVIPVIRADHLTPDQVRAYRLADNKLTDNSDWDDDLLRVQVEYLVNADIDFSPDLTGFSTPEIDLLLHTDLEPECDEEPIPPPDAADAVSRSGDIWGLGPNRLIVGDCRDPEVIDSLMDGALARMVLTDPPYNVSVRDISGLGKTQHREFAMASGEMSRVEFTQFQIDAFTQFARVGMDGSLHYVFMDHRHMQEILEAGEAVYGGLFTLCCWVKTNGGMGSLYRSRHELVFVHKVGTASHVNNVQLGRHGRYRTNVWEYGGCNSFGTERDESLSWHPTVKPTAMLQDAILDVTHPGEIVLDGFLGSGSTVIAAERAGRVCYGVELDPVYVDVAITRWQNETGCEAVLAGADKTFEQVAADRGVREEVTS